MSGCPATDSKDRRCDKDVKFPPGNPLVCCNHIARMGKRVEKAERNVGAATKKRKTKKPDRLNVKKMRGHKQY